MQPSSGRGRLTLAAIVSLLATACAPVVVRSYIDPRIDMANFHTYNWAPAGSLTTGDPRLDNNPFFHERVQKDVERELAARGFEKTTTAAPDLLLHYHASVTQRIDLNGSDQPRTCKDCVPYVYDAGTLLLDFVDARTNHLLWRAWADSSLDKVIDNQDWMEQRIDDTIARLVQTLPRGL